MLKWREGLRAQILMRGASISWPQHTHAGVNANAEGALSPDHNKHTPLWSQTTRQSAFKYSMGDLEALYRVISKKPYLSLIRIYNGVLKCSNWVEPGTSRSEITAPHMQIFIAPGSDCIHPDWPKTTDFNRKISGPNRQNRQNLKKIQTDHCIWFGHKSPFMCTGQEVDGIDISR